jgi:hypothetical protein
MSIGELMAIPEKEEWWYVLISTLISILILNLKIKF